MQHTDVNLKREQDKTLGVPRKKYGLLAGMLFGTMDLVYGRGKSLSKFKVLEVIARVPYQSWEHVAYIAMTHMYGRPNFARSADCKSTRGPEETYTPSSRKVSVRTAAA